ncbi:MAG: thioredoxin [Desulfovibrio sp.]|nr:thioredoxin [Desulfovibrio sp.]
MKTFCNYACPWRPHWRAEVNRKNLRRISMAEHVTDATFENLVIKADMPVLVDFWAPWCGPCRALGPVIDEIAKEYDGKIRVYKINVDENPVTPAKFAIRAIPTLILFKNGETLEQVTGGVAKTAITDLLDKKAMA